MLDQAQMKAVMASLSPTLVVASPGSGKTTVIVERIKYLIKDCNINPQQILVITFTRDAAIQMIHRFEAGGDMISSPVFGTFHSIFFHILSIEYGYTFENILEGQNKANLIKKAFYMTDKTGDFFPEFYKIFEEKMLVYRLSGDEAKGRGKLNSIISKYESLKRERNLIDFGDMIILALNMFRENPGILKKWQERFKCILIDEAQDMNTIQFELVKLLSESSQNVFAVGDEDQSIYGFRGSDPQIMMRFVDEFEAAQVFKLETNYRSTKTIVESANNLIRNNNYRFDKNMKSFSNRESIVQILSFKNSIEEADFVCEKILKLIDKGYKPKDIAVLYRNNNRVGLLASKLEALKIPFDIRREKQKQDVILRCIRMAFNISRQTYDRGDIFLALNILKKEHYRYLFRDEKVDFGKILRGHLIPEEREVITVLKNYVGLMGRLEPYALMVFLLRSFGLEEFVREYCSRSGADSESMLERFFSLLELAKEYKFVSDFERAVDSVYSVEHQDRGGVNLKTFHSAKGLEFKVVFIIDALEGVTPSNKALAQGALEEERRMFYVALTRAKRECYICFPNQIGEKCYKKSRFIDELKIL